MLEERHEGGWLPQYRFTLQPHELHDYAEMCRYHQTSPESHFTKSRVCSRATLEGRLTLSGMRFIETTRGGERRERMLAGEDEYASILSEHFGINMGGGA